MVTNIGCVLVMVTMVMLPATSAWPRAASWPDQPVKRDVNDVELLILHTNDMHARFEETSRDSAICTPDLKEEGRCYGGFARVAHVVAEARKAGVEKTGPPVIFLNAGDTYQGTVWYSVHKYRIVTAMMNKLKPDAASLGNHEFDDGVAGLAPFIRDAEFPVLAANLNISKEPSLQPKLRPVEVMQAVLPNDHKIGVIGYLTPETANISFAENVIFEDEVTAIRREAKKLKARGVNIIIALGHSGFDVDLKIAEEVDEVDVVVGGHTNTFLYTGDKPDSETPVDLYPTVVKQKSTGRRVPVVQAYAYTKYVGRLLLTFDAAGEVKTFEGNPQLLNASVPEDADVKEELERWRPGVMAKTSEVVGRLSVYLQGDTPTCRTQECSLGNLLADAFVHHHADGVTPSELEWTDASIALQHGGGVRSSLNASAARGNNLTVGDIMQALPFENRMFRCEMDGKRLLNTLEHSVRRYDPNRKIYRGEFLQVSGLRVEYDLSAKVGSRVSKVQVLCARCEIPQWEPLRKNESYGVLLPEFLVQGGDGYHMLEELHNTPHCKAFNDTDFEIAVEYFTKRSPITTGLDGRITFNPPMEVVAQMMPTSDAPTMNNSSLILASVLAFIVTTEGSRRRV